VNLHRIIPLSPFVADPLWSTTQVVPTSALLADGGSLIGADGSGGMIYWTAIPYDGADVAASQPSTGAGLTFDARLVYVRQPNYNGKPSNLVIGRPSAQEVAGSARPTGLEIREVAPARGTAAFLQMISFAGALTPPTTHLWLFWSFEPIGR
jgi:hypothetical protein